MQNLYIEKRRLQDQLATINKLIYGNDTLALAADLADLACRVDDNKADMLYGHEITERLHDLARLMAGSDAKEIYNEEEIE